MLDATNKLMLQGLALDMTRERAEKLFDECLTVAKPEQDGRESFIRDVMDLPAGAA